MRFSTIANLGNAPAIHNQNIVVKTCQSPPAAHQQPTEPTQSLCPVRACLAPISPQNPPHGLCHVRACFAPHQPTHHFVIQCYIPKPWKKTKSVETNFTWLRLVSKKRRLSKIANLGNAPAIHNQNIVVKTCQSPPAAHHQPTEPTQSLCPVRACVVPIRPQSLHMVFAPPEIVSLPPISPQSTLLFNVIYQNREKRKSVEKHFTWLRLV